MNMTRNNHDKTDTTTTRTSSNQAMQKPGRRDLEVGKRKPYAQRPPGRSHFNGRRWSAISLLALECGQAVTGRMYARWGKSDVQIHALALHTIFTRREWSASPAGAARPNCLGG